MKFEKSSFRDNSGFIFYHQGKIFRAITYSYKINYDHLINSGLYNYLVEDKLLIPHSEERLETLPEVSSDKPDIKIYKVIRPEKIDFISYPYEWCFSQLKDAALTTLTIQKAALKFGMTLKDSSAYNIQFYKGRPVLIDTLSFEIYHEGQPWQAYNQFCKYFLAPLALAAYCDIRLNQLLINYIDGIPLYLAKKILRKKAFINPGIFLHIYLHSKFQIRYSNKNEPFSVKKKLMSKEALIRLTGNLESTISKLKIKKDKTVWSDYYSDDCHTNTYLDEKKEIVKAYIDKIKPKRVLDLGANDGEFSKIAAATSKDVFAFDSDPYCIEECYNFTKQNNIQNLLPLVADLTNPSPSIGWANSERISLLERSNTDLTLVLAIIHHLCISNNLTFELLTDFLDKISEWLIIEFIPKNDPMVKKLLLHRKDIFENYNVESFEKEFKRYFSIIKCKKVSDTERMIYMMKRN
jgi:predicted nicotinamide N-methyase